MRCSERSCGRDVRTPSGESDRRKDHMDTQYIQLAGAFSFGIVIGWYVYYINRYRKSEVQLTDLVTLIGVLGGGAILAIFPAASALFGAYGVGLAVGFFAYFVFLI